ncbi:flagellar basal body L-ring protein FlgH [Aminithiophilus ramosus]|uniref:Flagellar L-ring protein n=3 Tax=Synergistia TaxID=649775 RepID=A0A9Q7EXM9_9BACT|nr:flagellar basal body L-ring protein FlgH [Aminithiophilus ramosus]QVL37645.1 flagellar basal body L-ring protein FlgH [Synergistota bacterium]
MKRKALPVFLIVLALALPAWADSLWSDSANLFADRRPTRVGDIVTVTVAEKTSTKDEGKTDLSKTNASEVADGVGIFDFIKKLGFGSSSTMTGDASTERKHTLTTTITCLVTEVLPNGNLVIEGSRNVRTHEENLRLRIEGVIRPQDVGPDNSVASDRVANATLSVEGKGSVGRLQKPGILTQILQTIF